MIFVILQSMDLMTPAFVPVFCGGWVGGWTSATRRVDSTRRRPSFMTHEKVGVAAVSVCMTGTSLSNLKV